MEGSLSAHLPQRDLHAINGDENVRQHQTPSPKNYVSCPGSYGEEWMASPKLASQPVLQVFHPSTHHCTRKTAHGVESDLIQLLLFEQSRAKSPLV